MPSADFAAAQERLAARRRQREASIRAREDVQRAANASRLSRLPYPLNSIGNASLNLWDAIKGREGTQPAFRVGQVDAELLDEELLGLFKGQVGEGLKYFGVR
jgi:peroxin-2